MDNIVINTLIGCGIPALLALATLIYAKYDEKKETDKR